MVRRRSLRRRSIKKSLRSRRRDRACTSYDLRSRRRDRACASYDLRSRRRKASYRFGAEQQSLISALAQIILTYPLAAKALAELAATKILEKCGIKEDGAIDENCPELEKLREYIDKLDTEGLSPVSKSVKFGVYPYYLPPYLLDMREAGRVANKNLAAERERQEKADEKHKKEEEAYNKKRQHEPKVLYYKLNPKRIKT
jgi:hypothetical protein